MEQQDAPLWLGCLLPLALAFWIVAIGVVLWLIG